MRRSSKSSLGGLSPSEIDQEVSRPELGFDHLLEVSEGYSSLNVLEFLGIKPVEDAVVSSEDPAKLGSSPL